MVLYNVNIVYGWGASKDGHVSQLFPRPGDGALVISVSLVWM